MNILVVGGTHGNETLGIDIVESLRKKPIANIKTLIGNPKAVSQGKRFIETDLNRSFGKELELTYEEQRATYIRNIASNYDVVLDFHNTQAPGNNTCFVGIERDGIINQVASALGFEQGIEATYDCINKYCPNVLSIEISIQDVLDNVEYWRNQLLRLARLDASTIPNDSLVWYRYLQRVTWGQKAEYELDQWKPFVEISKVDKQSLDINQQNVVPIFIGSELTEYYATLLYKTSNACKTRRKV